MIERIDNMTVREQIVDCFKSCRNFEDSYGLMVSDTHSLFILVQEDLDYDDGRLEYFIELNDTSSGTDEPCANYNTFCPIYNLDDFENTIINYLEDNGIYV